MQICVWNQIVRRILLINQFACKEPVVENALPCFLVEMLPVDIVFAYELGILVGIGRGRGGFFIFFFVGIGIFLVSGSFFRGFCFCFGKGFFRFRSYFCGCSGSFFNIGGLFILPQQINHGNQGIA